MKVESKLKCVVKITQMLNYPPKILIAFGETFEENETIFNWLLKNGYSELAA